jgi:hypothetical protein
MEARHRLVAASAVRVQVEMPFLEAWCCCERSHRD